MRTIKTIVADDEVLARSRVRKLLATSDKVQLLGEGSNGGEALKLIENYKPDLAFLDVEMPDMDGFQLLSKLPEHDRPFIVFVTAHDRFALKAFDVKAVDFIHKPYDDARFQKALDHAISHIELHDQSQLNHRLLQLVDDFRAKVQANPAVITFKDRGRERTVNWYDVLYLAAEGNYLKLQLERERFLIRGTMAQAIEMLDPACFVRIHRSLIVNKNFLKSRHYKGNNEYVFKMRNGEEFVSGRSFKEGIEEFFNQ